MSAVEPVTIPQEFAQQGAALALQVKNALQVYDDHSLISAQTALRERRAWIKRVTAWFEPMLKAADAAKRTLLDARAQALSQAEIDEITLESTIKGYLRSREQENLRAFTEQNAKRKAASEQQLLERAVSLEKAGLTEAAKQVLDRPVMFPIATPPSDPPKAEGFSTRKTYKAEVADLAAFVRWVADNPLPTNLSLLVPNMTRLHGMARDAKGAPIGIPGVVVKDELSFATR